MSHLFEKPNLTVESEDLALPEIHTGKARETELKDTSQEEIRYEDVAVPEVRISKAKHRDPE